MYMILIRIDLLEYNVRDVVLDLGNPGRDESLNSFVDDLSPVFGGKYYMVVTQEYAVGFRPVDGRHSTFMVALLVRKRQANARKDMQLRPYGRSIVSLE